jgi:hypothetical protein
MMTDGSPAVNVEHLFGSPDLTPVTDELQKITKMLQVLCPKESVIRFYFDGRLRVHIDLRRVEELTMVEALLPTACGGIFQNVQRGMAEKHSFFHRVTAVVAR